MQPYQQAILQALSIPRYISQTDLKTVESVDADAVTEKVDAVQVTETEKEIAYPQVPVQLLSDLSLALNQTFTTEQVRFASQLLITPTHITLPYPLSGDNKAQIYQGLCEHLLARK